jgi:phospholipid/cholesterol/gamma-HCH transport system substrate-binding protein
MDERKMQFRVGALVIGTVIILGILMALLGEFEWPAVFRDTYTVYIVFDDASGISRDTPVRQSGILIGRVVSVELQENGDALVTANIYGDRKLQKNDVARIGRSLIGGDAEIRFVRDPETRLPTDEIQPGDVIVGELTPDPLEIIANLEGDLVRTLNSVSDAGEDVGRVARRFDRLMETNEAQIARIIDQTERTMATLEKTLEGTNEILADPEMTANLRRAIAELPEVLTDMRRSLSGIDQTMGLANRNLENLEDFTAPLGERGDQLILKFDSGMSKLNYLLDELGKFSVALNDEDGSLSQLVNNPDLYQNLNEAAANINHLTRRMRPIVEDVRVLSDKAARNPGVFLRDAVQPGAGIK